MPKRVIQATIENEEEKVITKTTAIYQDNIIKYKEKDNTMVIYNYNKKKLIRENKELKIEYIFSEKNNTEGKLFIKDINQSMAILIKTKKIMQDELNIYIEFNIDKKVFKYRIEAIKWV